MMRKIQSGSTGWPGRFQGTAAALIMLGAAILVFQPERAYAQDESALATLRGLSDAYAAVVADIEPAVVNIRVERVVDGGQMDLPFNLPEGLERFFNFPPERGDMPPRRREGQGSGFIISADGLIVTNHHVIGDADTVEVTLSDGRIFTADVVGSDPPSDVALVRVEADNLPSVRLGNSDNLRVGEWVVAIGSPFGLESSVTGGIVSARGRSGIGILDYEDFIQTDAAINPGNSGGPLLNLDGEVVGLNTAIFSRTGGNMGIGLAIPINMVKEVRAQLLETGEVTRGFVGVVIQNLEPDLAEALGVRMNAGILVAEVQPDSPADNAGLQRDDIIIEFDGQAVTDSNDFRNEVAFVNPGSEKAITVLRDGERVTKTITIGKRDMGQLASGRSMRSTQELGLNVQNLDDEVASQLGYEDLQGVVVTGVDRGSDAARKGIRRGTLIMEVNREEVANVNEFEEVVSNANPEKPLLLLVRDGEVQRYVTLRMPE